MCIRDRLLFAQGRVGGADRQAGEDATQQQVSFMRDGVGLNATVGELHGESVVAVFFGGYGEKVGGGWVVGIHGQRLAERFGLTEVAVGALGGKLAAELEDGFGWENHGIWGWSARSIPRS